MTNTVSGDKFKPNKIPRSKLTGYLEEVARFTLLRSYSQQAAGNITLRDLNAVTDGIIKLNLARLASRHSSVMRNTLAYINFS